MAAPPEGRRDLPAGDPRPGHQLDRAGMYWPGLPLLLFRCRAAGLRRHGGLLRASEPARRRARLRGRTNSTARGDIWRREFGELQRRVAVPAFGLLGARAPGLEVPLSGGLRAASGSAAPAPAALHRAVRRLEHRAQADRPEELENQPEEFRFSARGARMAGPGIRQAAATSMRFVPIEPAARTSTPGGRTAARPARRTSAGASTTRSPAAALRRARSARRADIQAAPVLGPRAADHRLRRGFELNGSAAPGNSGHVAPGARQSEDAGHPRLRRGLRDFPTRSPKARCRRG